MKPRPEFEPFFRLNYEEFVRQDIELATRTGFEPVISGLTGQCVSRYTTGPLMSPKVTTAGSPHSDCR